MTFNIDAAVEAALRTMFFFEDAGQTEGDYVDAHEERDALRPAVQAALAAALPHLRLQPAELAEQQGDLLRRISLYLSREAGIKGSMLAGSLLAELEGHPVSSLSDLNDRMDALAATGKQQVGEVQGDMFWLAVDGERMGYSVEELIDDMCDGEEVEIQTAVQLPNFWVRVKAGDGASVDFDVIDQRDAAPGVGE